MCGGANKTLDERAEQVYWEAEARATKKAKTLNTLRDFAASVNSTPDDNEITRAAAATVFMDTVNSLSAHLVAAEPEKMAARLPLSDQEAVYREVAGYTLGQAMGDLFWAIATLAVAHNLDLDAIIAETVDEYTRRHEEFQRAKEDPIAAILRAFGIGDEEAAALSLDEISF